MYFKALTATMILASAGLSVGLPAAANDAPRLAVEPTTTLPNLRLNRPFAREGYNPVPARDPFNYNNANTCGEDNGGRMCDDQTPGGGSCCSQYGYCGETKEYCGRGCQAGFSLGNTCHHNEHKHDETNHCGPNHGNKKCDDGYCCGNDGKCGKGHCDGKVSPLPAPEKPKEERCGPKHQHHKCSNNQCCSRAGYCGIGKDFCSVPENCQRNFGWCDSEAKPAGPVTNDDLRSPKGKIDSDTTIMKCKKPMTIAMTFDDGPSENTQQLLDILSHHGAKATFFISGNTNGKGPIDQVDKWVQAIRRMDAEGHQLGSHTWDHAHMDKISSNARREELLKNERALANIVGKYPTYMRPPYVECGDECMADMKALGYHVTGWEVDSTDWQNERDLGTMTRVVDAAFDKAPADGNMLLIQHDTLPVSALELTKHVLKRVEEKGWKAVTLSECLGEPKELNHRYPDVFDASIISHGGCAVSSGAGCLELESFYDKVTCFSILQGCVKQLDSPVWQVQQASLDYAKAKGVCDKLYYFCAQCDEDSAGQASKCDTKSFHFPQW